MKNYKHIIFSAGLFSFLLFTSCFLLNSASAVTVNRSPSTTATTTCPGLSCGLVGYWTFDGADLKNNVTDKSGSGNTGYMINMATSTAKVAGKMGQALKFDGVNDYVKFSNSPAINYPYSVSFWFKSSVFTQYPICFSADYQNPPFFTFTNKKIAFRAAASGQKALTSSKVFSQTDSNKWWHVVVTVPSNDVTTWNLYINAALNNGVVDNTGTASLPETTRFIGAASPGTSNWFSGSLDDVRIYNRALPANEIKQLYNMGATKVNAPLPDAGGNTLKSGLVGYWTFDGADVTDKVYDKSGRGNNSYWTGGATTTAKVSGKIGQAMDFNNNQIILDNMTDFNFSTTTVNAFTLSAWVRPDRLRTSMQVFTKGAPYTSAAYTVYNFGISNTTATTWRADVSDGISLITAQSATGAVTARQWQLMTLTWDGTTLAIYKNAVSIKTSTSGTFLGLWDGNNATKKKTAIGKSHYADTYPWYGKIDDVRFYNRALSAAEIKVLYNLGSAKVNTPLPNAGGTTLKTGLVGYWTFDGADLKNNAADKSGNNKNGYLIGFGATSTAVVAGKMGQGLKFDGVDDYVKTGSDIISASASTTSAWVYASGYGQSGAGRIIDNGKFVLEATSANSTFGFSSDGFNTQAVAATNALPLNKWTHIIVTRNSAGTANFYVNGVLSGTANQPCGTPVSGTTNVIIGNVNAATATFKGLIDEVRIYNRILSAAEIKQLYNLGR